MVDFRIELTDDTEYDRKYAYTNQAIGMNGARLGYIHYDVYKESKNAIILDTYVQPRYRRTGIATALVRRAISEMKLLDAIEIQAHARPKVFDEFWKRFGFVLDKDSDGPMKWYVKKL